MKKVGKSRADGARQSQRRRAEGSYMEEDSEGDENIDTMMDITCVAVSRMHGYVAMCLQPSPRGHKGAISIHLWTESNLHELRQR